MPRPVIDAEPWAELMGEEAAWFAGLRWYGAQRGRKPGWAAYTFKERFGYWPPREIEHYDPVPPDGVVIVYIQERNKIYAKGRRKAEREEARAAGLLVKRAARSGAAGEADRQPPRTDRYRTEVWDR